jgi:hypothetical protein
MRRFAWVVVCALSLGVGIESASAQGSPASYGRGARWDFGEEQFVRVLTWHQFWARAIENNPGSMVAGNPEEWSADIALRRSRLLLQAQFFPEVQLVFHLGINNQSFVTELKPQLFIHDAWASFRIVPEMLEVGAGLHYWNGISRITSASTINMMTLDMPILNWPTIDQTDQFARQLGIFAHGHLDRFHYRVAVNHPFRTRNEVTGEDVVYNPDAGTFAAAGYFAWQFLDRELGPLPYAVGTSLGTRSVFNLGAGFYVHPDAMASLGVDGARRTHTQLALGLDAYLDVPIDDGALTAYAVYYHYDFGPDYVRGVGVLNLAQGGTTMSGAGNAVPLIGTGEHVYAQLGYLLPWRVGDSRFQPYVTAQVSVLDALDMPSTILEAGFNWFIFGHHAKLTLHYRNRPVFVRDGEVTRELDRRSELILQAQVFY